MAQVIFLHLSVIHSVHGGVCLSACWDTTTPQIRQTPRIRQTPQTRQTPLADQTPPPLRTRLTPPDQTPPISDQADHPPGSRLQHTVYEWLVRILLECILVVKVLFNLCIKLVECSQDSQARKCIWGIYTDLSLWEGPEVITRTPCLWTQSSTLIYCII